ncbi:MAG: 50S ribosomal protein L9 [Bacteroidetes bacterium]|nr:50S ribosomal protein L9 [Bacteroidota bacterium]
MKLILTQDVRNLGHKDDVVSVRPGYGRNFLIPKGMAKMATESALKMLAEDIKQRAFKQDKIKKDAEALAGRLEDVTVVLKAKTGTSGKIFGAVTSLQVANALKDQGIEVDRRKIVLSEEPKVLGSYKATINLHKEVSKDINIEVVAE